MLFYVHILANPQFLNDKTTYYKRLKNGEKNTLPFPPPLCPLTFFRTQLMCKVGGGGGKGRGPQQPQDRSLGLLNCFFLSFLIVITRKADLWCEEVTWLLFIPSKSTNAEFSKRQC